MPLKLSRFFSDCFSEFKSRAVSDPGGGVNGFGVTAHPYRQIDRRKGAEIELTHLGPLAKLFLHGLNLLLKGLFFFSFFFQSFPVGFQSFFRIVELYISVT
jgi:hypothetical protein